MTAFMRHLAVASGFCDLGMWQEANDALDELEPELRAEIPALVVRARICHALGAMDQDEAIRRHVDRLGGVLPEDLMPLL